MKQAINIFRKDVRKLWPHAGVVSGLFVLYAMSPLDSSLVAFACWTITTLLIHEDSPADESPFWITRPYSRISLLTAKALFLFVFVFLPLLASGILLEARNGVSVLRNTGHLLAFDTAVSVELILLAIAIGTITNNLKSVVGAIVAIFFCSFAGTRLTHAQPAFALDAPNILAWAPTALAALCIVGIQYAARKTQWSRVALAAAVIASAFLMPRPSVALASNRIVNPPGFDLDRIRIAFDESTPPHYAPGPGIFKDTCPSVALKVEGLPPGTELRAFGANTGIFQQTVLAHRSNGYRVYVCNPGPDTSAPETLHVSLDFEVVAVTEIATIPARPGTFSAGKYGRCEILTPFPENTQLRCDLEKPLTGAVSATLEYPGYSVTTRSLVRDSGPFQLSPVSREKFDGTSFASPGGWPFEEAFARPDAHFVLRTERIVGTIRRDLVYRNFVLPWNRK